MKILAVAGAAVLLAALAFLHPAPRLAPLTDASNALGSRPGSTVVRQGRLMAPARHDKLSAAHHDNFVVIYVAGEVRRPGLYRVPPGARANDAVEKAGSFSTLADRAAVNLAEVVQDGEEIRVPRIGETLPRARARKSSSKKRSRVRMNINLNSATAGELAQVPGLGQTLAERIVAYRAQNGPFASLDELADVSGFTPRRIDALSQYLVVR